MINFKWSEEGIKNVGLSDTERSALEKTLNTQLKRSLADSEKVWKKQQASLEKLYRKYWSQFEDNLRIELKKIKVSPKKFEAEMLDWINAKDPKLRDQVGEKINTLYHPALQQAFGSLGDDLIKLRTKLEKAVVTSPTAKFQWIGPIGFTVVE